MKIEDFWQGLGRVLLKKAQRGATDGHLKTCAERFKSELPLSAQE